MKHILVSILFMLACCPALGDSLQKPQSGEQLPLSEAYRLGKRYMTQQTDSALYYLGLITSRYNEKNIGELKEDEKNLLCYWQVMQNSFAENLVVSKKVPTFAPSFCS